MALSISSRLQVLQTALQDQPPPLAHQAPAIPACLRVHEKSQAFQIRSLYACQASLVAQLVKNPPAMWETWIQSLGWEDPLEKGTATHSSILVWRISWSAWSMGLQRVGHYWATFTSLHFMPVELPPCNALAPGFCLPCLFLGISHHSSLNLKVFSGEIPVEDNYLQPNILFFILKYNWCIILSVTGYNI